MFSRMRSATRSSQNVSAERTSAAARVAIASPAATGPSPTASSTNSSTTATAMNAIGTSNGAQRSVLRAGSGAGRCQAAAATPVTPAR